MGSVFGKIAGVVTVSTAMKFVSKFFRKWSFFDQNQQPFNSVEPFERIRRALPRFISVTPVAGLDLLPEKVSDSPNFSSEFFFPNSDLLCSFLGLWIGFINPSLQSLVNQYFSQTALVK